MERWRKMSSGSPLTAGSAARPISKPAGIAPHPAARWVGFGGDTFAPGSIHGVAPYGRVALQTKLAGGTFEVGASALKAALFPSRDRSSGLTDRYTDLGLDGSWQKAFGTDNIALNL